ncbi:hypothetical protein V1511DRAFT_505240 [Dipodascopsis uninucleata]
MDAANNQEGLSFGTELKDGFKVTEAWIGNGVRWLEDIQGFYRERALLEKEYSTKLLQLTKKYFDKKAKKSISLSVGDSPQVTPGSLESASLVTWTDILTQTENIAMEKDRLANELTLQVADQLRGLQNRYEDFRKRHVAFAEALEEERDEAYSELKKSKQQYDAQCQIVENSRVKVGKSYDGSKSKATKQHELNIMDMNNAKNSYLISINVTNRLKDKYYFQDIPTLLDSMQDLNEARVRKLNHIWNQASSMEIMCIQRCREHLEASVTAIGRNDPALDSAMFMQHNVVPDWAPPPDFLYEPSPIWHDDEEMIVDEPSKVFLRNKIAKSRRGINELRAKVEQKQKDIESLYQSREQAISDPTKGNFDEIFSKLIITQRDATLTDTRRIMLEVEVETVELVVGDIVKGTKPHDFKPVSFKIPTTCMLCNDVMWGLSRHGHKCRSCGYTCHSKCEMKVPANCEGVNIKKKKKSKNGDAGAAIIDGGDSGDEVSSSFGGSTMTSHSVFDAVSHFGRRRAKSTATKSVSSASTAQQDPYAVPGLQNQQQEARAKFAYAPNGDGEIALSEGDDLLLLEPHDGTGWVFVRNGNQEGLVPFSYIEVVQDLGRTMSMSSSISGGGKKKGPAVAPKRGAKKINYVIALYDYAARSDAELTIHEGDKIRVTGSHTGEGWTEGELNGAVGSFPTDYAKPVE